MSNSPTHLPLSTNTVGVVYVQSVADKSDKYRYWTNKDSAFYERQVLQHTGKCELPHKSDLDSAFYESKFCNTQGNVLPHKSDLDSAFYESKFCNTQGNVLPHKSDQQKNFFHDNSGVMLLCSAVVNQTNKSKEAQMLKQYILDKQINRSTKCSNNTY